MSKPISEMPTFVKGMLVDIREVLYDTSVRVQQRMSAPGKPRNPGEKVDWDGEVDPAKHTTKQQRAFFASHGFGHGIPFKPTGAYELSWQAARVPLGATVTAPHPAGAIGGMPSGWQSKIHRGRRPFLLQVLFEELAKIPDEISNKFSVRAGE